MLAAALDRARIGRWTEAERQTHGKQKGRREFLATALFVSVCTEAYFGVTIFGPRFSST